MSLRQGLSDYGPTLQGCLFPRLNEELGPLTEKHKQLITVLEMARIEVFVQSWQGLPGRPPSDRSALCLGFVAKTVLGLGTTVMLIEPLMMSLFRDRISEKTDDSRAYA